MVIRVVLGGALLAIGVALRLVQVWMWIRSEIREAKREKEQ